MCDNSSRTPSPAPLASLSTTNQDSIVIIQHNCATSNPILISLFSSFKKYSQPAIVAIQEPFLFNGQPPSVPSYTLISPPNSSTDKVRCCFYIQTAFLNSISLVPLFFNRGHLCGLSLSFPSTGFRQRFKSLTILNAYNSHVNRFSRSLLPASLFVKSTLPTLVLGDFNIHHPSSDPLRAFKRSELALSNPYHDTALENNYVLLNTPGSFTRISNASRQRSSVLDLCFANSALLQFVHSWTNNLPSSGSDHTVISIKVNPPTPRAAASSPQWDLTPWPLLTSYIENFQISPIPSSEPIDSWFDSNLSALTAPI